MGLTARDIRLRCERCNISCPMYYIHRHHNASFASVDQTVKSFGLPYRLSPSLKLRTQAEYSIALSVKSRDVL